MAPKSRGLSPEFILLVSTVWRTGLMRAGLVEVYAGRIQAVVVVRDLKFGGREVELGGEVGENLGKKEGEEVGQPRVRKLARKQVPQNQARRN